MRCCKGKFNRFKFGNIAIGFGNLRKTNDTGRGLRVRFNGVGSLFGQLAGSLRDFSADFVGSGSFSADLSNIKQLDASIAGQGTLTGDLADFVGLLDDYPNAAAAYSVRLLSSTYSGALVRIRKDTGGQPEKDFYPDENGELSLDSEDGGNTRLGNWIGSNDGFVVTWYSQAGVSGRDATQSSASSQPKIISGGSLITDNGKAALEYTSGNQELTLSLDFTNTHSVFTVNNFSARGKELIGASSRYLIYQDASNTLYRLDSSIWRIFGATISNNQQLLYVDRKPTNVKLYENGVQIGTQQTATGAATVTNLSGENSTYNFLGTMQEVVIYTSDESSNQSGIETNINDFYTIY